VKAARVCFAEEGYSATDMRDIAKPARIFQRFASNIGVARRGRSHASIVGKSDESGYC